MAIIDGDIPLVVLSGSEHEFRSWCNHTLRRVRHINDLRGLREFNLVKCGRWYEIPHPGMAEEIEFLAGRIPPIPPRFSEPSPRLIEPPKSSPFILKRKLNYDR